MLKTTVLLGKLTSKKLEIGDGEDSINIGSNNIKHVKKSGKSKTQKLSKS